MTAALSFFGQSPTICTFLQSRSEAGGIHPFLYALANESLLWLRLTIKEFMKILGLSVPLSGHEKAKEGNDEKAKQSSRSV